MCLLLETIKIENRRFARLEYHQARIERSLAELGITPSAIDLHRELTIPEGLSDGFNKCRVIYGRIIKKVEFLPYVPREINTLKVIHDDQIDYHLKFALRDHFVRLLSFREDCDDILIVKNGLITDTSYSNILFYDGYHWITPYKPLLEGTQRQYLLDSGFIIAKKIEMDDLAKFQKFMLINAMLEFDEKRALPICNIVS